MGDCSSNIAETMAVLDSPQHQYGQPYLGSPCDGHWISVGGGGIDSFFAACYKFNSIWVNTGCCRQIGWILLVIICLHGLLYTVFMVR
jgi:hypothetical protein